MRDNEQFEADLAELLGADYMGRWFNFQNVMTTVTAVCGGILLIYQLGGKAQWIDQSHIETMTELNRIDSRVRDLEANRISRDEMNDLKRDVRWIREYIVNHAGK